MSKIKIFCCIFPAALAACGTTPGDNTQPTHGFGEPQTAHKIGGARTPANDAHPWANGNNALAD